MVRYHDIRVIKVAFISSFSSHIHLHCYKPMKQSEPQTKNVTFMCQLSLCTRKKWLLWVLSIYSEELHRAFSVYMVVPFGWEKMPMLEAGLSPKSAILPRLDQILGFIPGTESIPSEKSHCFRLQGRRWNIFSTLKKRNIFGSCFTRKVIYNN